MSGWTHLRVAQLRTGGNRARQSLQTFLPGCRNMRATLLLAISVTCKLLSDDEPRFAKFAACSDALVVAFSRCSAVPTVLGSCCKPSPSLQLAETGKVALLSATFATCQLLADCETRFSPVAATVCSEPKCVFFGCQLCWAVAVGLLLRCSSHKLAKQHYCQRLLRLANYLLLMHKSLQRLQLALTQLYVRCLVAH